MSVDPYHAVQNEIQTALLAATNLRASYRRISSTAREDSEELNYARNELKATLSTLEADIDDLDESVKIVEQTGARKFGLDENEVIQRRQYVQQVRREVESMRDEVSSKSQASRTKQAEHRSLRIEDEEEDDQAAWSHAEQQMIMREQDTTLDTISGTLTTIAEQAGLIGREVVEHNEMLGDLEQNVDRSDTKLTSAMKRMQKIIRDTEETKSGWCIVILIIILCVLLLMVILI
ncbi:hypothetical protein BD410DRAFT_201918 [Rickenella mellea]|uniref:t-SNARE coiled-coil homology domain-containing protein n=1 Tax=Rickenella mellea TaxID=50990 RepID=A0A4Y7Q7P3_9AGAM|nr:hypothetical protein BD410DRAFT_201918 [Rickenella mellea]